MVAAMQQPVLGAASSNLAVACFVSVVVSCWTVPLQPNATRSFRSLTERNVRDKVTDFNRSRFANVKLDQLNASVIKPPDHLEGLPMERDGQLNPKYRKEVLLGAQASAEDQDDALLRSVYSKLCIRALHVASYGTVPATIAAPYLVQYAFRIIQFVSLGKPRPEDIFDGVKCMLQKLPWRWATLRREYAHLKETWPHEHHSYNMAATVELDTIINGLFNDQVVTRESRGHLQQDTLWVWQHLVAPVVQHASRPPSIKLQTYFISTWHVMQADENQDGQLSIKELEKWIAAKVKEHYSQAVRDNFWIFSALDKNHDGRVSWDEYHVNFMLEKGFDDNYAKHHPEDHKGLERSVKEKILLDKASWFEAANSNPDALNIDEFLTFRHPEHSHVSLLKMVNDIISNLDENGDEQLSEEEFAQLTPDETTRQSKEEWKKERILEFRQSIDQNGDGRASRQELLMYNDPENPVHARSEARELVALADTNGDNKLSLDEVLAKKDIFLGSKMVNTARNIHDEF